MDRTSNYIVAITKLMENDGCITSQTITEELNIRNKIRNKISKTMKT